MTDPALGGKSDWFAGLVLGAAAGLCVLVAGFVGLTVLVAGIPLIAWKGPRSLALTGLVTGIGLVWTVLWARVWLTCDVLPQPPGTSCDSGGISPWVLAAFGILMVGLVASALVLRRSRR